MYDRAIIRQRDRNHQTRWPITSSFAASIGNYPPGNYPPGEYPMDSAAVSYFQPANDAKPNRNRFVIHLPVNVADMGAAMEMAASLGNSLAHMPEVDRLGITVSDEEAKLGGTTPRRIFCGSVLADQTRCPQRYMHTPPCGELAGDET